MRRLAVAYLHTCRETAWTERIAREHAADEARLLQEAA